MITHTTTQTNVSGTYSLITDYGPHSSTLTKMFRETSEIVSMNSESRTGTPHGGSVASNLRDEVKQTRTLGREGDRARGRRGEGRREDREKDGGEYEYVTNADFLS